MGDAVVNDNAAYDSDDEDREEEESDYEPEYLEPPETRALNPAAGGRRRPRVYRRDVKEKTDHNRVYLREEDILGVPTKELFYDEHGHPYRADARTGPQYNNNPYIQRDGMGRLGSGSVAGGGQPRDKFGRFIDKVGSSYNKRRMRDELRRLGQPPPTVPNSQNRITPQQDLAALKLAYLDIYLPRDIDPIAEHERIMAGGEIRNYGNVRPRFLRPYKPRRTRLPGDPPLRRLPRSPRPPGPVRARDDARIAEQVRLALEAGIGAPSDDEDEIGRNAAARELRPRRIDLRRPPVAPVRGAAPPRRNRSQRNPESGPRHTGGSDQAATSDPLNLEAVRDALLSMLEAPEGEDDRDSAARRGPGIIIPRQRRTPRRRPVAPASPDRDTRHTVGTDQTARHEAQNADEVRMVLEAVFGPPSEDDSAAPAPMPKPLRTYTRRPRVAGSNLRTPGRTPQSSGPMAPVSDTEDLAYRRVQIGGVTVTVLGRPGANELAQGSPARGTPRTPVPSREAGHTAGNSSLSVSNTEDNAFRQVEIGDVTVTVLGPSGPIQYTQGESQAQGDLHDVRSVTILPNTQSRRYVEQQESRRRQRSESGDEERRGRSVRQRTASPLVEREDDAESVDENRGQQYQQEYPSVPARPAYWSSPSSEYADPELTEIIEDVRRINFGEGERILGESDPDFVPESGDIIVRKNENSYHHLLEYYDPDKFTGVFQAGDKSVRISYGNVSRGGRWLLRVLAELHICTGHQGTAKAKWVYVGRALHLMRSMSVDDS